MSRRRAEATLFSQLSGTSNHAPPQAVAVIDIGASSIRMAIGEIRSDGSIRTLETLTQAISLGRDTFTNGVLSRGTIEDCVRALTSYREVLASYGIKRDEQLRCVATSAVREAQNRMAFLDRVYIATGIKVEPLDAAEVSRITYLGVAPTLKIDPHLIDARNIVIEIGGGSTEVLVVEKGLVAFSHTYNFGSLRLQQMLDTLHTPLHKEREIMENHIGRLVGQVVQQMKKSGGDSGELIALGGDFRFAASLLVPDRVEQSLSLILLGEFEAFVNRIFPIKDDELVQDYHLSFPDATSLGPALLTMLRFAQRLGVQHLRVSDVNLRDGLLRDMASQGVWSDDFREQVLNAAIDLGRKFQFDEVHARHVAMLSKLLFDALQTQHRLDARYGVLLKVAALLHEVGMFIGMSSYHKHSMYLIQNSELFGISRRDLLLISLVARYHRRASPKPAHPYYSSLQRDERVIVTRLASILRLADALDRSYSQRIREMTCTIQKDRFVISVPGLEDLSLEQLALKQTSQLFEETFGMSVLLRRSRI